ncbi:MAG: hypothetical protein Ct9H300mP1_14740 [Planctomycetaceae bacterium]|nr:MAG: hypothetical protein Ct9H300mP1_14740 [Planctomycetaceae bacterium]
MPIEESLKPSLRGRGRRKRPGAGQGALGDVVASAGTTSWVPSRMSARAVKTVGNRTSCIQASNGGELSCVDVGGWCAHGMVSRSGFWSSSTSPCSS